MTQKLLALGIVLSVTVHRRSVALPFCSRQTIDLWMGNSTKEVKVIRISLLLVVRSRLVLILSLFNYYRLLPYNFFTHPGEDH